MTIMKELNRLIEITDQLLGPQGCPWDREQTLKSLRPCIIEEACELIEAIDLNDQHQIQEELGDFFFVAFFLCKIAEKEKHCELSSVLKELNDKLVRRHPHVFGNTQAADTDAVLKQWTEIKQKEKNKTHRKSSLDSIPKDLPGLARAQKVYKKMRDAKFPQTIKKHDDVLFDNENSLGEFLLDIVAQAHEKGLDAEHALRQALTHKERDFRTFEKSTEK